MRARPFFLALAASSSAAAASAGASDATATAAAAVIDRIPMDFPDGSNAELLVRRADDPRVLVSAFCARHGCSGSDLPLLVAEVHRRYLGQTGACPPGLRVPPSAPVAAAAAAAAAAGAAAAAAPAARPAALAPSSHCVCASTHRLTPDGLGCTRVRCFGGVCSADWRWLEGRTGRAAVDQGAAAAAGGGGRGGSKKKNATTTTSSGVAFTLERDDFGEEYAPGDVFNASDKTVQPQAWREQAEEQRARASAVGGLGGGVGGSLLAFVAAASAVGDLRYASAVTPIFLLVGALACALVRLVWVELCRLAAMPDAVRRRRRLEAAANQAREGYRVLHVSNAGRGKTAKASKGKAGGFVTNRSGAPKGRVGKKV